MKNRIKKSLSLLLAVIMLLCAVPMSGSAATYNVTAAVNFANAHWNDGIGLCAEFVSRCLNAGGISIPNYSYYSSGTKSYENNSGTLGSYTNPYTCSASLLLYLSEKYKIISNPSNSDIDVGDVVFMYSMSNGQLRWRDGHVGLCVKKVNGAPKYAAHNKAQSAGGFSSSYPCTYVAKVSSSSQTHTVNSSYDKNFTAYPKAKITAGNIYDANHNQISSTAWIGTSDKCTINEVYTDGCCKVSYPLDSGGTKTVYSKISLFNVHTHSYKENYESAHPHKKYMKCSCGDWYYTGATTYLSSCSACNPTKVVFDKDSISLGLSKNKTAQVTATISGNYSHWICEWDGNTIEVDKNQSGNKIVMTISSRTAGTSHLSLKAQDQNYKTIAESAIDVCVNYDYNSTFKFSYSSSDGTGDTLPFTVKYGDTFTVLNNSFKRDGYHFDGWNVKRNSDNTWYVAGVGWCSEESIKNNKYEKKNYTNSQELVFNESWVKGLNSGASYTFYATWIQNNFNMRFDANSGTGYMNKVSTEFDIDYTFPDSSFARKNYVFSGWNVYRVNDGRWATVGYGWLTADELKSRNINKQLFAAGDTYKLDDSWKNGCNDEYIDYIAYATWSPCQHNYSVISTVASTCAKEGYKLFECQSCGAQKTETIAKNPSNHVGGTSVKNAKAATCTAKGYTGDTYCLGCGVVTAKGKDIAVKAHTYNSGKITTAATCKATGVKTYTCTVCKATKTETIAKNPSNHVGGTKVKNATAATCTAKGYTGDTYCLGCGVVTAKGKDIAIKAHTYDSGKITTAATCKSTGVKTYTCTVCKATKTETIAKNPSNHVGGTAVKNAKAATCTAKGYTGDTYCLGCGVITAKGTEISAKGHGDSNNDGKCDTCGVAFGEPEKPDTPNTPDAPSGNCNHICHKKGIAHFFYLIARLFWKIFNTNKYCSCGTPHY